MCRNLPFYPCTGLGEDVKSLESETFDLLLVTHKFPVLQKVYSKFGLLNNFCNVFKAPSWSSMCVFTNPKMEEWDLNSRRGNAFCFHSTISYPFI